MPPRLPDDLPTAGHIDAPTRPHADNQARREGDMPIIEFVHVSGGAPVAPAPYGSANMSSWPHTYASPRPHGFNPYLSTYPRRPR